MNLKQIHQNIFVKLCVTVFVILPYCYPLKEDNSYKDMVQGKDSIVLKNDETYSTEDNDYLSSASLREDQLKQQLLATNSKYNHFDSEWTPENVYSYDKETPSTLLMVTNPITKSNDFISSYVSSELLEDRNFVTENYHNTAKRQIDKDCEETETGRKLGQNSNYLEKIHSMLTKFIDNSKMFSKRSTDMKTDMEDYNSDSFEQDYSNGDTLQDSSDFDDDDYTDGEHIHQDHKEIASLLDEAPVEGDEHNKQRDIKREDKHPKAKENKGPKTWDQWGKWSPCSVTCGTGKITRWRHCMSGACAPGEKEAQLKTCIFSPC